MFGLAGKKTTRGLEPSLLNPIDFTNTTHYEKAHLKLAYFEYFIKFGQEETK